MVEVETKIPLHITKKKTNTNEDKFNYKEKVKIHYLGGRSGDKDGLGEVVFLSIGRGCGGVNIVNDRNENIFVWR